MDNAVALVQTYLHVNGYFTIAEYPIIGSGRHGGYRAVTDLDILAFRFPGANNSSPNYTVVVITVIVKSQTPCLAFRPIKRTC